MTQLPEGGRGQRTRSRPLYNDAIVIKKAKLSEQVELDPCFGDGIHNMMRQSSAWNYVFTHSCSLSVEGSVYENLSSLLQCRNIA